VLDSYPSIDYGSADFNTPLPANSGTDGIRVEMNLTSNYDTNSSGLFVLGVTTSPAVVGSVPIFDHWTTLSGGHGKIFPIKTVEKRGRGR